MPDLLEGVRQQINFIDPCKSKALTEVRENGAKQGDLRIINFPRVRMI